MSERAGSATATAWMAGLREQVDDELARFLEQRRRAVAGGDPAEAEPFAELARVIGAGGKRLRPMFCYWGYRACSCEPGPEIVKAAASLELLHTFALIHDDIMDRSPLRRGLPATHVALADGRDGRDGHFGVSAAILVGDLALSMADELFCESGFPPEVLLAGFRWYNRMRAEVVAGQHLDLVAASRGEADEATTLRIAELKSGGYTVEKPLLIGATLGRGSVELTAGLGRYGAPLGQAFQLRDDVLGAFGEPGVTGKDAEGDLREGKQTYLVARARAMAAPAERRFLDSRLGRADLTSEDARRLREIIQTSGALACTLALIDELREESLEMLTGVHLPPDAESALRELADLATVRES